MTVEKDKVAWNGGSQPMTLREKKLCSVGRKWEYTAIRQKAKKLIPVKMQIPVSTERGFS